MAREWMIGWQDIRMGGKMTRRIGRMLHIVTRWVLPVKNLEKNMKKSIQEGLQKNDANMDAYIFFKNFEI